MNNDQMIQALMGMLSQQGGNGLVKSLKKALAQGGQDGKTAAVDEVNWKGLLQQAYSKTHKTCVTKETFVFSTESNGNGVFKSGLICEDFSNEYTGTGASKKAAEANAAERAVKAEFPAFAKSVKSGGAHGKKVVAAPEGPNVAPMRVHLANAFTAVHGQPTAESLVYEVQETGTKPASFVATLTSPHFSDAYSGEGKGKKDACDVAANAAMQAEFPDEYNHIQGPKSVKNVKKACKAKGLEAQDPNAASHPKGKLSQGLNLLAPLNVTKETVNYNTAESNGKTVCTLVISCLQKSRSFKGEADGTGKEAKKQAEMQAAEKAVAAISPQWKAAEARAATKKEEKKAEWKVMLEQKKLEAQNAKAAGGLIGQTAAKRTNAALGAVKAEPKFKKPKKA